MFIYQILHSVPTFGARPDRSRDFMATLHSYFTCNILVALALLVSFKQFGGMLFKIFMLYWTVFFRQTDRVYAATLVYVFMGTVRRELLLDARHLLCAIQYNSREYHCTVETRKAHLVLSVDAILFAVVGRLLQVTSILLAIIFTAFSNSVPDVRKENVKALTVNLQGALRFYRRLKVRHLRPHKIFRFLNVYYKTYYVTLIYFGAKIAFLINVAVQLRLLNIYLQTDKRSAFGYSAWMSLVNGVEWETTGMFPRVSLCDLEVREMGNIQMFTVQCVLVINIFIEKIFILLWMWYNILTVLTALNLLNWIYFVLSPVSAEHFVLGHLTMCDAPFDRKDQQNVKHVSRFVHRYMQTDGVFVLRMLAAHADVLFTSELIYSLWKSYYEIEETYQQAKKLSLVWPPHELRQLREAEQEEIRRKSLEMAVLHKRRRPGSDSDLHELANRIIDDEHLKTKSKMLDNNV